MKTHWKKTFNKDYLGSHDLDEGQELKVTIKEVKVATVKDSNGKDGQVNVAYFTDKTKPMILNVTACKQIKKFAGTNYIEEWKNIPIQIYVANVRAFGEVTEALRIRPKQPTMKKPDLIPTHPKWSGAVEHYAKNKNLDGIKKHFNLSAENEKRLINEAKF
jgi:hypothetical protein